MAAGMMDVRRMGAVGDGVTEDGPAFAAAFEAAGAAGACVPPGTYRVTRDLFCDRPVRFEGRLLQPEGKRLVLGSELRLSDFVDAFGDEDLALRKAVVALFAVQGDATLDLCAREVGLDRPIRIDAACRSGAKTIRGGLVALRGGGGWRGPEVFALSIADLGPAASLSLDGVQWRLADRAGGLAVRCASGAVEMRNCAFAGAGRPGLRIAGHSDRPFRLEECELRGATVEAEGIRAAVSRCRFEEAVLRLSGRGNRISGCRFSSTRPGLHPGLVLSRRDTESQVSDCDFDGTSIRWQEPEKSPVAPGRNDFAGLSVTGSRFTGRELPRYASWIEIAPAGPGRSVHDLSVTGNLFASEGGNVERVEAAEHDLVPDRMQHVTFGANTSRGVMRMAESPASLQFRLPVPQRIWLLDIGARLPFGARPGHVVSVLPVGSLTGPAGRESREVPAVDLAEDGALRLRFGAPVAGTVTVVLGCGTPG